MKVSFKIDGIADAETAVARCAMIAEAFRRIETPQAEANAEVDQPNLFDQVVEPAPAAAPAKRRSRKQPAPVPVPEQEQSDPDPEAREQLLILARARGIVWAREVLGRYRAAKFSDLMDDEVAEIIAA
jgi:hypothetical protein